ncbi:PREDICTED: transmembrane protein 241 isoform X2 [Myotis davidii]|uniref:transmembrane protein 241 isoform X2 n=1 Tax=Myotis davidii TaxID=225400 RepID=UPI0007671C31|nr:PREDICTED: transmembrane protein 241 isoform X2 [Myotis davidii]
MCFRKEGIYSTAENQSWINGRKLKRRLNREWDTCFNPLSQLHRPLPPVKTPPAKICSALLLLAAAGSLPFNDAQFDPDGYFWAVIHLLSVGAYKSLRTSLKPRALSDIDQQYLNYIFSVALLAAAAHPTGDLLRALDFPFLYVYRFHGSCCASGLLGFLVTLSAVKLKSLVAPGQCAAWLLLAQVQLIGTSRPAVYLGAGEVFPKGKELTGQKASPRL